VLESILCPICRVVIHTQHSAPIYGRSSVSSRASQTASAMLTSMMLAAEHEHEQMLMRAEEACRTHFSERHPRRLQLWEQFRWRWLMTRRWPWSRTPSYEQFDFGANA